MVYVFPSKEEINIQRFFALNMLSSTNKSFLRHITSTLGLQIIPIHGITKEQMCTCQTTKKSLGRKCEAQGKHPFLNVSWQKIATNNYEKFVSAYCGKNINVAVATGRKSEKTGKYLVVIDIDKENHKIIDDLPTKTIRYKTGSGGYHYWFWSPVPVKNSVKKLAPYVDVRGSGGYVIIPPSNHVSGNKYRLLSHLEETIADLPEELLRKLTTPSASANCNGGSNGNSDGNGKMLLAPTIIVAKPTNKKSSAKVPTVVSEWWAGQSVQGIRSALGSGQKIPVGSRNSCIHRMLSSDRAKGALTYEELHNKAVEYVACAEDAQEINQKEIHNMVSSVMKYPAYNTKFESVNKIYCLWMKNKKGVDIREEELNSMDNEFFSTLRQETVKDSKTFVSLDFLIEQRKTFLTKRTGHSEGFATYTRNLLAKKLLSLGFERKRTNKGNLWGCSIQYDLLEQLLSGPKPDSSQPPQIVRDLWMESKNKKKTNMETKVETKTMENDNNLVEETVAEAGAKDIAGTVPAPIGPDGEPLIFLEERVEEISTDRKYHPNAKKYLGRPSTQEIQMAIIRHMKTLTKDQIQGMKNRTYLHDEARTRDFFDFLEVGDVLGIQTTMYRIVEKTDDQIVTNTFKMPSGGKITEKDDLFTGPEKTHGLYDLDYAMNLGVCELLYRNDKPYGVENDLNYRVTLRVYEDKHGRTYVFRNGKEVDKNPASRQNEKDESASK